MNKPDPDHLENQHFSDDPATQERWQTLHDLIHNMHYGDLKLSDVEAINLCVNSLIKYKQEDRDYWQLPHETLNLGTGDCEDIAILKFNMLLCLDGEPVLLLVTSDPEATKPTHMVTGYILPYRPWWKFWAKKVPTIFILDNNSEFCYPLQQTRYRVFRVLRDWDQMMEAAEGMMKRFNWQTLEPVDNA